ncbi:DUF6713 family protein [Breznakiella homolactica]|uniref:Uncharacterized protein n=1 Tax=Breznakiella homolactica TaxID=2798577 RepID=A0A7T8BB10_9SPIR|nr:DUF6713 family protein [Breznakiella homolactica]QQO08733.1 hypothetical protein JFL75_17670 [Breznakiella homolactica]
MIPLYSTVCTLLLLHEIESAYEKEWEILHLPGKITGFLLMHIPIIAVMFLGLYWLAAGFPAGNIVSLIVGIAGLFPFTVHKLLVRRKEHFGSLTSNIIIIASGITGIALAALSIGRLL